MHKFDPATRFRCSISSNRSKKLSSKREQEQAQRSRGLSKELPLQLLPAIHDLLRLEWLRGCCVHALAPAFHILAPLNHVGEQLSDRSANILAYRDRPHLRKGVADLGRLLLASSEHHDEAMDPSARTCSSIVHVDEVSVTHGRRGVRAREVA
eukprot:760643-Hanusia_phi.AAC.1